MNIYKQDWRELRIALFDVETTGLKVAKDRVSELGIVVFENGIPVESYCKMFNTCGVKMSDGASRVTGITDEMLEDKKTFADRIKRINRKLVKEVDCWCAFNDQFDRSFIRMEFKKAGVELKELPTIDPLIWARDLWPNMKNTLSDVIQRLRISPDRDVLRALNIKTSAHRADYDSIMTGLALMNMSAMMPKTLRQTLYVQDFLYRRTLLVRHQNNAKFKRSIEPTMPPEHIA